MTTRIDRRFADLQREGRAALVTFTMEHLVFFESGTDTGGSLERMDAAAERQAASRAGEVRKRRIEGFNGNFGQLR